MTDDPRPKRARRRHAREVRDRAIELRQRGWAYSSIQAELGVPKSTLSGWLHDVVLTEEQREALAAGPRAALVRRAAAIRAGRIRRTEELHAEAAEEIGTLTERELFFAGIALYWAEGAKAKPWNTAASVSLINSDPAVILLFLRWLRLIGVQRDRLQFRVAIHRNANVEGALAYWSSVVGVPATEFQRTVLKRHEPKTRRRNTGLDYRGCLIVRVRRSTDLNRTIAGWWYGLVSAVERDGPSVHCSDPSGMV